MWNDAFNFLGEKAEYSCKALPTFCPSLTTLCLRVFVPAHDPCDPSLSSSTFRQNKNYNKELYADFIAAQIKTLSFLAYIIRIYQVSVAGGGGSPVPHHPHPSQNASS